VEPSSFTLRKTVAKEKDKMERLFRRALRRSTPEAMFRRTLDGLGLFCTFALILEHVLTIQRSDGPSMYPAFSTGGDHLLISGLHRHGAGIQVGDVVRFYHPSFLGVNAAKRVLGMPGDFVCKDPPLSTVVGEEQEMIQVRGF
jgi:mitochondrial inner membrane protease subunit 1